MFKKRKSTGAPADADIADGPDGLDASPIPTTPPPMRLPSRPVDSGLGVPPYRPAGAQPAGLSPASKESPAMGRAPNPPPASSMPAPVRPMPQGRPVREPAERRTLVVGRGISVQGTVQDAERLVVEGTVEATMISATELAITQGGVFKGEVEVEDAEVAGTIDGILTVRGNLIVRATGRVLGKARCRRLQVEDGGQITGQIEMITEPKAEAPKAAEE